MGWHPLRIVHHINWRHEAHRSHEEAAQRKPLATISLPAYPIILARIGIEVLKAAQRRQHGPAKPTRISDCVPRITYVKPSEK